MRRIRYQVASSLDGYIVGPNGEIDWIVHDPDIDFAAMFAEYDTLLMGRRTYESIPAGMSVASLHPGQQVLVFSRTLRAADHAEVTIVADRIRETVEELRAGPGKDIWLFGGGELCRSLLALDCVDTIEPAVMPVVLGGGTPLLPGPPLRRRLVYTGQRLYPKTGIVHLAYDVVKEARGSGRG